MNRFSTHSRSRVFAFLPLFVLFLAYPNSVLSQIPNPPPGEPVIRSDFSPAGTRLDATQSQISIYGKGGVFIGLWNPPKGRTIIDASFKTNARNTVIVMLDGGYVWKLIAFSDIPAESIAKIDPLSSESFNRILGDALYALTTSRVYVSRDSGATWQVDDAGLSGAFIRNIALDTLQYVYAATSKGLYKQHPDSSIWNRVTTFPTTNPLYSVFVDRRNRIYVGSDSQGPYYSTDNGTSWTNATTGFAGVVIKFRDDARGNIYAITNAGFNLWRLTGGTGGWTRIDQPISNQALAPNEINLFNDVGGDSTLVAATAFGVFLSTDNGTTWTVSNRGISAENIYGYRRLANGRRLAATNLGVFYISPNDTDWTKTFPTNGYLKGTLFQDGLGNLYAQGARTTPSSSTLPKTVWKSTDNGSTWTEDDQGLATVTKDGIFYVDENGRQYLMNFTSGVGTVYSKSPGLSWATDIAGFNATSSGDGSFTSDGKGTFFVSAGGSFLRNGLVFRRPIAGGTWTVDTAGLGSKFINAMARDKQGNIYASAYDRGLYRRAFSNGVWTSVAVPSGLTGKQLDALSVDSTGALFASFFGLDVNFVRRGLGAYYTKDNGATWKYAGLDSVTSSSINGTISVSALISYGDSTFASTGRGLFLMRSTAFAQASLSTKNLSFGNVRIGQFKDTTITITNTGNDLLTITNITSSSAIFSARPTTRTLSPGQPYKDTLRFSPSATGSFSANIVVTSNSATSPDTIRVTGTGTIVSSVEKLSGIPTEFSLSQNFPNPFNPSTTIRYSIAKESRVLIEVYNLIGQRVATLVDQDQTVALYQVHWNTTGISTGVYTYRLEARPTDPAQAGFVETKKLLLLK